MTVLAAQGARFASVLPGTTADTLLFTATLDSELVRIFITNVTGSPANVRLHHVPAAGAAAPVNALFYDFPIAANTTLQVFADAPNSGIQLKEGDTLVGRSSVASSLAFNIYGVTTAIAPGANS